MYFKRELGDADTNLSRADAHYGNFGFRSNSGQVI